jgi:hypothetical protein
MKTKLTVISLAAILVTACTTGTRLTKTYDDDIYFSPADVPPVAVVDNTEQGYEKSAKMSNNDTKDKKIVMSQMERNPDGTSTVNNYIYQQDQKNGNPDYQSYNVDNQDLVESDTTLYYNDDEVKTVINNYYDDNDSDIDFGYRINRFHRPFYYGSLFYDDWYYGGYYSPWYSNYYGFGYGWNYGWGYDPFWPMAYGYYSPAFAFGLGGYWGWGYGYGYGGYYNGYWNGYYNGFGSTGGGFYNSHQIARRRDTNMTLPGGSGRLNNGSISGTNAGSRPNSVRYTRENSDVKNATIVNDRRQTSVNGRRLSSTTTDSQGNTITQQTRRSYEPSTTGRTYERGRAVGQNQNYTPSYNKPRVVNQSNYNSSYSRPRTSGVYNSPSVRSSNSGNQTYTEPRSSSSMRQTYRSSSSYSTGSSSNGGSRNSSSYSGPAGNSGSTYSAPARSSSNSYSGGSGSYSSGSSSSGSSSGGSSGGGGGSGHRR